MFKFKLIEKSLEQFNLSKSTFLARFKLVIFAEFGILIFLVSNRAELYEECHVTPADGENENETEHVSVTLKEQQKWRKPSQRAGQFLFNYRKRRDAQSLTSA